MLISSYVVPEVNTEIRKKHQRGKKYSSYHYMQRQFEMTKLPKPLIDYNEHQLE